VNHWIVDTNDVPADLAELCTRASDRQKDAEQCEREYKTALNEAGLDPAAVNNRGVEVDEE
jgi:ribonuclease R